MPAFELQKRPLQWRVEQEGPEGRLLRQHQDPPLGGAYFPAACHCGKIQPGSTLLGICAQTWATAVGNHSEITRDPKGDVTETLCPATMGP